VAIPKLTLNGKVRQYFIGVAISKLSLNGLGGS